jgi:hypothetical protein
LAQSALAEASTVFGAPLGDPVGDEDEPIARVQSALGGHERALGVAGPERRVPGGFAAR